MGAQTRNLRLRTGAGKSGEPGVVQKSSRLFPIVGYHILRDARAIVVLIKLASVNSNKMEVLLVSAPLLPSDTPARTQNKFGTDWRRTALQIAADVVAHLRHFGTSCLCDLTNLWASRSITYQQREYLPKSRDTRGTLRTHLCGDHGGHAVCRVLGGDTGILGARCVLAGFGAGGCHVQYQHHGDHAGIPSPVHPSRLQMRIASARSSLHRRQYGRAGASTVLVSLPSSASPI